VALLVLPAAAAGRSVTFRTDDGVTLSGTWYEPSAPAGPAVILVHMLHRSHRDWDPLATRLAAEGIGALAFDLRGHGDSTGAVPPDDQYTAFLQDVAAARRFVAGRSDVVPHRLGMVGASLGAALVMLDAAQNSSVTAVALLSASTEYRGLRIDAAMKKYTGRALLAYSDDDPYAQRSARDLIKLPGPSGTARETLMLHHAGHGTNMLTADPTLLPALVDWFKRTL
jgi:alpha-beta hydrolase superfamily lysophospholipase